MLAAMRHNDPGAGGSTLGSERLCLDPSEALIPASVSQARLSNFPDDSLCSLKAYKSILIS